LLRFLVVISPEICSDHNKKAGQFAKALHDTWDWMPADLRPTGELWSEQISGEMTTKNRNKLLDHLREPNDGSRKVLSNVRVLEGKDQFADRIELLKTLPDWVWNTHEAAFEAGWPS
jgi:hypothetical protein